MCESHGQFQDSGMCPSTILYVYKRKRIYVVIKQKKMFSQVPVFDQYTILKRLIKHIKLIYIIISFMSAY